MISRHLNGCLWSALAGGVLVTAGASAQQNAGLEEIIVTAQKRAERLQDTPISISALSGDDLARLGAKILDEIAAQTPSLTTMPYPTTSSSLFIFIRGQGSADPGQITQDGSVGLYVDGFYIARAMVTTFDIGDVDRVEVLRGPQGTLYGRNTTGGAVNIITKKPSGEFNLKQELTFGNYNQFRSLTTLDLPTWNGLSAKVSYVDSKRDGFVKNLDPASHDFNELSQHGGRVALHWDGPSGFSADYSYERANLASTGVWYVNPLNVGLIPGYTTNPYKTYRPVYLPESPSSYTQNFLTLTWEVSDALTIKSLSGWRHISTQIYQDFADGFYFAPNPPTAVGIIPIGLQIADTIRDKQFSQELQAVGDVLDGQIKYAAGLYFFKESGTHAEYQAVQFPAPPPPGPISFTAPARFVDAASKSRAVYAQVTWTPPILDNRLDVTLGGRYTKDRREATITDPSNGVSLPIAAAADFSRFNPSGTVSFKWSDDLMTYFRVATAYRSGGFAESSYNFATGFGPEKVKSYELGVKSELLDNRVRVNAAVFQTDYTDMQLTLSPDGNNPALTQTFNAGEAKIKGLELDVAFSPISGLTLSGSYVKLDPQIEFVEAALSPYLLAKYPNGNAKRSFGLSFVPKTSYTLAADYAMPVVSGATLSFHADVSHRAGFFQTASIGPDVPNADRFGYSEPGHTLANARISYDQELPRGDKLRISPWVKNLTNKDWAATVNGNGDVRGFFGQERAAGYPRMWGVDLTYSYR